MAIILFTYYDHNCIIINAQKRNIDYIRKGRVSNE